MADNPEYAAPTAATAPDYAAAPANVDYGDADDDGDSDAEMAQYQPGDPATDTEQDNAYEVGSRVVVAGYDCQGTLT